jgi:hypothetical protein
VLTSFVQTRQHYLATGVSGLLLACGVRSISLEFCLMYAFTQDSCLGCLDCSCKIALAVLLLRMKLLPAELLAHHVCVCQHPSTAVVRVFGVAPCFE